MSSNAEHRWEDLDAPTYRHLVERASDGVVIIQDGILRYANPTVSQMFGYSPQELSGKPFTQYVHPDDVNRVSDRYRRRMAGETLSPIYETRLRKKSGEYLPVELNAATFSFGGKPADVVFLRDIRERKSAEQALRRATRKIEQLHEAAYLFADCADPEEIFRETVRFAEEILEFSKCTLDIVEGDRLVVKATSNGLGPQESRDAPLDGETLAAETLRTGKTYVFGCVEDVPAARPAQVAFQSGISVPVGRFGVFQVAATEKNAFSPGDARLLELLVRHAAEALERLWLQHELEEQATHDPLTGVYNRRHFTDRIGHELERSRRYEHPLAFLMIDIDGFKSVNDRFGHQTGDRVLREVACAIQDELRSVDIVIRYGGDEFLAILPETNGEAESIAERLRHAIVSMSRDGERSPVPITLAIGMAYWSPGDGSTLEDVLRLADARMYEAKRQPLGENRRHANGHHP